jgi:hypothetical protein
MAKTVNDIPPGPLAVVAAGTITGKVPGDRKRKRIRITGDNSYPAGGYPVLPADAGFASQIDFLDIINENAGTVGADTWLWNTLTQKLQLIVLATGAEIAAATNCTTAFCDVAVEGV